MAQLGTRLLTLTIDGTDRTAEVSSATIDAREADAGFVSFQTASQGGAREYVLKLTFVQNPSTASLWNEVWENAGTTVPCVLYPAGGVVDADHPSFTGNVVLAEPDGTLLGGDADSSASARWVTECEWVYTAKPVRSVA